MINGVEQGVNKEGTPQGGPLSSILSNILLDKLDKELEKRGHRFIRYADDVCLFVKSQRSAERVLDGVSRYIEKELKLKVNGLKSEATHPRKRRLLGYKSRVRQITSRNKPYAKYKRYEMLKQLNRGWSQYFKLNEAKNPYTELDSWVQCPLHQCYWKQWKTPSVRVRELAKLGMHKWKAYQWGNTRKGYWRTSHSPIQQRALNKSFLKREGYLSLTELSTLPTELF